MVANLEKLEQLFIRPDFYFSTPVSYTHLDVYKRQSFDCTLGQLLPLLGPEDLLMVTADHGCDPGFLRTTDHTREYVPLLIYGAKPGVNLGTVDGFGAAGATACAWLGLSPRLQGENLLPRITA